MTSKISTISDKDAFDKILTDNASGLVVVHFSAAWAPQCHQVTDVLSELAADLSLASTKFIQVEAETLPELSKKYEITAVPTCVLIKNASVADRVNGADVPSLNKKIRQHSTPVAAAAAVAPPKQDLNARLKALINRSPVMLFMKGAPEQPKCGFSKTIVQILKDQGIKFDSFDILQDEEVRQGLKKFSDWPTYPQLYAKGELLGGLDIVKEMVESGELKLMLPAAESLDDRLKKLTNQDPIMLFMKGNPDSPRCGFSKTTVALLDSIGIPYGHFDILTDEEVRQGLKTYSNWPTYPQLYIKGELVGGLDILKEMNESGELEQMLKDSQ
ncbi:hypothetical protein CAPTEDRAFT_149217 [Capitella teleta]|uniref:Thioredoxin domain-containing protein n=1 Tax=Capitella teleta TaxID=283909 RepID=R7UCK3_CAPTE|nr:hypothetical protein CAPTEDRAFT_149217 [Capitella teleta]|eukprot:ELU04110.1 hypothetical protein CAPTEDRAFT_149217 [Capitella teleta]